MPPTTPQLDALVVGAGWAGLQCALQLAQAGKRVVCLEARKRLGGRAFTHTWDDSTPMDSSERHASGSGDSSARSHAVDFGCSYIHGYNEGNPAKQIAEKYGIRVHTPKATASEIIGPDGQAVKADLAVLLQGNLAAAQEHAKLQGRELRKHASLSNTNGRDGTSLASLLLATDSPLFHGLTSEEDRKMAIGLAQSLHVPLGTELDAVALDYFGSEKNFAGTDAMPEGGFTHLIRKVADDVQNAGGQIRLGEVVSRIAALEQTAGGVHVMARAEDGKEYTYAAKTAIVTIPLANLKKQMDIFEPALEEERRDAITRTTVGNLNKVLLSYQKPWWNEEVGTFHILPSKLSSDRAPSDLGDLFSSSSLIVSSLCAPTGLPPSMTSPSLLVMIGGQHAKYLEEYGRLDVAEALHKYLMPRLRRKVPQDEHLPLKHAFYSRWARQPFTGGATTTPVTRGNSPQDFSLLGKPAWKGQLLFAGEHCQPDHRGSIAGAIVSANEAVQAAQQTLKQNAARY